jgi:sulfite reductase alpha subunit-like flavoprotein
MQYDLAILYGSQTGTAKFASEELERELLRYGYSILIQSMDEYDMLTLPEENFVIFLVATTGYGEPPSNMKNFWQFLLRKDLPENSLSNLNYTIFGLGDSSYEKYNSMAILLNNRLKQLSAELFHPVGLGDDQQDFGYETEFDPWCASLVTYLSEIFGKKLLFDELPFLPKYEAIIHNSDFDISDNTISIYEKDNLYKGTIKELKKLTHDDSIRQVYHLEVATEVNEVEIRYSPGDVALIYPKNSDKDVDRIIDIMGIKGDFVIEINLLKDNCFTEYPRYIKARELFQSFVNINGIPHRYFCKIASRYTSNEIHKEKLELFANKTQV